MDRPEFTHYERVLNITSPYEREAQSFAARAFSEVAPGPEDTYFQFLQTERKQLLDKGQFGDELAKALLVLNGRSMSYLHHLTQEALRRQKVKGSFPELALNKAFGRMVCAHCATNDVSITNVVGHMNYHMAMHRMAGRKVFDVSPGLAEKLHNTELRGLTADDLKLPFPNVYITVPKEAELQIYNVDSNWHQVVGIYLTEDVDGKGQRCWRFLACGETKPITLGKGIVDDNDALVYFHVPLPEKMPLTETVALAQEEVERDVESSKRLIDSGFVKMLDKWQAIFRWAMNVVLYQSWEGAEKEEVIANEEARKLIGQMATLPRDSKKRHKIGGRLSSLQPLRRIFLGRSIRHTGWGWELTVRVLVMGHWRNQPYGPKSALRKLIWIEPYWKGKDKGAIDEVAGTTPEVAPVASSTGDEQNGPRNGTGAAVDGNVHTPAQTSDRVLDGGGEGVGPSQSRGAESEGGVRGGAGSRDSTVDRAS